MPVNISDRYLFADEGADGDTSNSNNDSDDDDETYYDSEYEDGTLNADSDEETDFDNDDEFNSEDESNSEDDDSSSEDGSSDDDDNDDDDAVNIIDDASSGKDQGEPNTNDEMQDQGVHEKRSQ